MLTDETGEHCHDADERQETPDLWQWWVRMQRVESAIEMHLRSDW